MADPDRARPCDPVSRVVEAAVDVAVFAPIGLAAMARERLPELAATGRQRVEQRITLARFVGRLAVEQGRRELERRWRAAVTPDDATDPTTAEPDLRAPGPAGADDTAGVDPDVSVARSEAVSPPDRRSDDDGVASVSSDELPIDDYESLAASHVVARLGDLDADELTIVESFERAHRNRRTVLGRIDQLRSSA